MLRELALKLSYGCVLLALMVLKNKVGITDKF